MTLKPNAKVAVMTVLRALIAGVVVAGCLAGPVSAQQKRQGPAAPAAPDDRQKERDAETVDKQYKATLERTRKDVVAAPPADPWQNLRGGDDPKTKR
jgi:hypothetical protein